MNHVPCLDLGMGKCDDMRLRVQRDRPNCKSGMLGADFRICGL
jgi:hypothetical protein